MVSNDYPTQSTVLEDSGRGGMDFPGRNQTAGLVLCGGQGRRMGGKDKGLIRVNGAPAVLGALKVLTPFCEHLFISANRHHALYRQLQKAEVIPDLRDGYQGPLAGMEALLPRLKPLHDCTQLLVLPCDLPNMSESIVAGLLAALEDNPEVDIVYASAAGQAHYLCAAMRRSALTDLNVALDEGLRAVRDWYSLRPSMALEFENAQSRNFFNRNQEQAD